VRLVQPYGTVLGLFLEPSAATVRRNAPYRIVTIPQEDRHPNVAIP
jgi:hypothetical protein